MIVTPIPSLADLKTPHLKSLYDWHTMGQVDSDDDLACLARAASLASLVARVGPDLALWLYYRRRPSGRLGDILWNGDYRKLWGVLGFADREAVNVALMRIWNRITAEAKADRRRAISLAGRVPETIDIGVSPQLRKALVAARRDLSLMFTTHMRARLDDYK